jgi:hypothetical protein
MPPQQADRLLDLVDDRLDLCAHEEPSCDLRVVGRRARRTAAAAGAGAPAADADNGAQ